MPLVESGPVINSGRIFNYIAELRTKPPKLNLVKRMYNARGDVDWKF